MTDIRKVLGQSAPTASTTATAYNVPASREAIVSSILFCNRAASAMTLCATVVTATDTDAATDQYIYSGLAIPANDTFIATIGITLSAGDQIRVNPSNSNLTVMVFGVEIS